MTKTFFAVGMNQDHAAAGLAFLNITDAREHQGRINRGDHHVWCFEIEIDPTCLRMVE